MSAGFWFGADGSVIGIEQTHILAVISEPARFGETRASLGREYARFDEPIPCERRAREVILRRVIGRGWIRVRRYRDHWAATVWKDDPATRARVGGIARWLLKGIDGVTERDRFALLRMNAVGESVRVENTLGEWASEMHNRSGDVADTDNVKTAGAPLAKRP
ncbi:MAG TPA: hypothetical protein VFA48_00450 [Gammaproteobacteria bacterium]|nr:hypothetical protein [Gammaproteobacteria bacterium]